MDRGMGEGGEGEKKGATPPPVGEKAANVLGESEEFFRGHG